MQRSTLIEQISQQLGNQTLVWIGTRCEDALPLGDIPQFTAAFGIVAPLTVRSSLTSVALEDIIGVRVDLDLFDIDCNPYGDAVRQLREDILRSLSGPSAIVTYRPSTFASAIGFARSERCRSLGLFADQQSAFEHKPWVETAVARMGLPRIRWRYIADIDQLDAVELLREGPVMLRRSRTTGGVGLVRVDDEDSLLAQWPDEPEAFVSVAPFIDDAVSVNIGAVVWRDGVTVHPMSVQLIGVESCTARPFGYCGNDFGAASSFDRSVIQQVERSTLEIGNWMRSMGYLGAFGIDYLVKDGVPMFTEVNPRFQGSTLASSWMGVDAGESCILTEHVASFLGVPVPDAIPLHRQMATVPRLSNVVVHNTDIPRRVDPRELVNAARRTGALHRADVLTSSSILTEHGGTVARLMIDGTVTTHGRKLLPPWDVITGTLRHASQTASDK